MATIKSYTDLSQSKKLAKILPLESADMYYREWKRMTKDIRIAHFGSAGDKDVSCWSLAALLGVLPNNEHITTTLSRGGWKIDIVEYLPNTWWWEYEDEESDKEINISADNPIDACYEMIMKLHELKML